MKPKRQKVYEGLERDELKALLSRGETERGSTDAERVSGLGAVILPHSTYTYTSCKIIPLMKSL